VITAIVVDIEGTTSPTAAVREDLYGYTRAHLLRWLLDNRSGPAASGPEAAAERHHAGPDGHSPADAVMAGARELSGRPDADEVQVAEILCGWLDSDVKAAPLKAAQGLICAEGFRSGALHGEFFADAPAALTTWHDAGIALYVYSSGSVRNQQDWFTHARNADLSLLIRDWFDLNTAGPKREASSYAKISGAIGTPGEQLLFLSDHPDELDAASTAGWRVLGVTRPGEPNSPRPPHRWIGSFAEVDLADY